MSRIRIIQNYDFQQSSNEKCGGPRGNGVMDSALACHAGGQGSIPIVDVYSNVFFSPSGIGVRKKI